jgi:peptidoglycan hydrolase-like protein with peptidoglycan-binding domain
LEGGCFDLSANNFKKVNDMKKIKTTITLFLILVIAFSCFTPLTVSAASNSGNTNYSKFDQPETKGDYAYYNGSKSVKSKSTTTSEIKWMQAALNYCVKNEGLNTAYISVDGSFGPASKKAALAFQKAAKLTQDGSFGPDTIKKMISVLKDGKKTFASTSSTSGKKNLSSVCKVTKTYKIGNEKYYMASLKKAYNGIAKGEVIFLHSNYTAVTNEDILEKLLFTRAVDELSKESNGFKDLVGNYYVVEQLNNVCKKILEAQMLQKMLGSASGSAVSIAVSANPQSLIAASEYLTKESYITIMTFVYLDKITSRAVANSNLVKKYCADGVSSYEEAEKIVLALIDARAAFLLAGTDCMLGLVSGYTNKKSATLNSLKTYCFAMGNTLLDSYGGIAVKILNGCNTGKDVISALEDLYDYIDCDCTARFGFKNMFKNHVDSNMPGVKQIQNKAAK